jgi:hypothetical protein
MAVISADELDPLYAMQVRAASFLQVTSVRAAYRCLLHVTVSVRWLPLVPTPSGT